MKIRVTIDAEWVQEEVADAVKGRVADELAKIAGLSDSERATLTTKRAAAAAESICEKWVHRDLMTIEVDTDTGRSRLVAAEEWR